MTRLSLHKIVFLLLLLCAVEISRAQTDSSGRTLTDSTRPRIPVDSLQKVATPLSDSTRVKALMQEHSPRKAAIRSAVLPGWGQIYNKKYWKLPIVYGALGISGAVFRYNLQWYRRTRYAYKVLRLQDTANYKNVHPRLQIFISQSDQLGLQNYRDEFRKYIDYSAIVFLLLWGLNVVDASVDAHLKTFDVSPDLSFKMHFGQSELAGTTGISFILALK